MSDIRPEVEALARKLCLEMVVQIGEEAFRSGAIRPDQLVGAAMATMRTVDQTWREHIPDAEEILAGRVRH